jgi:hypothetical protein
MGQKPSQWRKDFADLVNAQLEQIGSTERVAISAMLTLAMG